MTVSSRKQNGVKKWYSTGRYQTNMGLSIPKSCHLKIISTFVLTKSNNSRGLTAAARNKFVPPVTPKYPHQEKYSLKNNPSSYKKSPPPPTKNKPPLKNSLPPPPEKFLFLFLHSPLFPLLPLLLHLPLFLILSLLLPLLLLLCVAMPLLLVYRYTSPPASTPLIYPTQYLLSPLPLLLAYLYRYITSPSLHLLLPLLLHLPLLPYFYSTYQYSYICSLPTPYPCRCFNFYLCPYLCVYSSTPPPQI